MQLIRVLRMSVERYVARSFHRQIVAQEKCPHCQLGRAMLVLGYYDRYLTGSQQKVWRIVIRRFQCSGCGRTVSILPSFAQPYRLVRNALIDQHFNRQISAEALPWISVLKQYWRQFVRWVPEIVRHVGMHQDRAPPRRTPQEWWEVLVAIYGTLDAMTRELVGHFGITLFGRYQCHVPHPPGEKNSGQV